MKQSEFVKAIKDFFEKEGINCLSQQPLDDTVEEFEYDEPYFSWSPCDCCGDHLGGDREDMCGYNPTMDRIQKDYKVCMDCASYLANGDFPPDMEMDIPEPKPKAKPNLDDTLQMGG